MARKTRIEFAGACYHVLNRGNYRRDLFAGTGTADSFRRCLFEACVRFDWRLHAFVIMRNHFHLAVETPEPNLSVGMQWLQSTWAARFNRYRKEVGRPFQGRYKALHVEPGHALAQVAHYIHLNPVRAKIVTAEHAQDYRWSSLHWFLTRPRPAMLIADTLLRESGALSDNPHGWRCYIDYLGLLAEADSSRREEKFDRLTRDWAIGSAEFKAGLRNQLLQRGGGELPALLGSDGESHHIARAEMWEEQLQVIATALSIRLELLPPAKSAPAKVLLAAIMKAGTPVSNGWLACRLHMGKPASVSQFVRRFHQSGAGKSAFQQGLSAVKA